MDFDLNEEQRLLKDSIDRFMSDAYGDFEKRKAYQAGPGGYSTGLWSGLAELGVLALPFAEEDGGIGGGPVETMIVMEAIGRGLAVEPYLSTVVLGGGFLRLGGTDALRAELVPQVADGSLTLAFAQLEPRSRYDLHDVSTTARRDGEGFVLDGVKAGVLHGDSAGRLVVSARTAGARRDRDGVTLFLVDAASPGVTLHGMATQDGLRSAEITLRDVRVPADAVLGEVDAGLPLMRRVTDIAIAALCAEAVGTMDELQRNTVDYLKARQQFGVPIGSFQALQHRAADMLVAVEQARSMALYAAMMAEEPDAALRQSAISAAKVQVNNSARKVGQEAVQLQGGIAMTWEYKAGHYFKRLAMIEKSFGDTDHHLGLVSAADNLVEAE
ncbi:pimeloyl-CoA dehydrogenase small subunit [Pseudoroseomonas wenyumeiae]|uniref:Pimeloyl-CoA dehydrogenase small subunit n=1 Tax=Teichococcus wenyumeiae TaxID=2478470 RepID=A0A3A9J902_9PROT|nr:acyl-CoA dehydrogenase [Pseudoroseomonas wenyumeiae]RKK01095.1 pimeloyl-CoA dehydrogenase small subunit [Pseudoroseomonas wenyumeiae]RMI14504.1 pimeloyl-CoA dehydrogenase small subunit [Pseudoroseomonas wenyumeiae]